MSKKATSNLHKSVIQNKLLDNKGGIDTILAGSVLSVFALIVFIYFISQSVNFVVKLGMLNSAQRGTMIASSTGLLDESLDNQVITKLSTYGDPSDFEVYYTVYKYNKATSDYNVTTYKSPLNSDDSQAVTQSVTIAGEVPPVGSGIELTTPDRIRIYIYQSSDTIASNIAKMFFGQPEGVHNAESSETVIERWSH